MAAKRRFRVIAGISYPPDKRAEPGDVVDDIPENSIPWLLKANAIEPARSTKKQEG